MLPLISVSFDKYAESAPGELDAARLHDNRLAIACHESKLLTDLHAAADRGIF